jgi:hypothetical protein
MSVSQDQNHSGGHVQLVAVLKALLEVIFADGPIIDLKKFAKNLPSRPHLSTVYRWTNRGLHGVKLGTFKLGGRRYTSRELVLRFVTELGDPSPNVPSTTQDAQLRKAGAAERAKAIF